MDGLRSLEGGYKSHICGIGRLRVESRSGAGSAAVRAQCALAEIGRGPSCSPLHLYARTPDARELRHIALG